MYLRKQTTFRFNKEQPLTVDSYLYTREYKRQLIKGITSLLDELDIKFVLSHGNLLEHIRGKPILHDDDVDIRFDEKDLDKWKKYCQGSEENEYNLVFDGRFHEWDKQLYDGIQIRLKEFKNEKGLETFSNMDIHADLVVATINRGCWISYDIDFEKRRETKYLGEKTYIPSEKDTHKILKKDYGDNIFWSYKRPNCDIQIIS